MVVEKSAEPVELLAELVEANGYQCEYYYKDLTQLSGQPSEFIGLSSEPGELWAELIILLAELVASLAEPKGMLIEFVDLLAELVEAKAGNL